MPDVCLFFVLLFTIFIIVVTQKLVLQRSKNVTAKCTETSLYSVLFGFTYKEIKTKVYGILFIKFSYVIFEVVFLIAGYTGPYILVQSCVVQIKKTNYLYIGIIDQDITSSEGRQIPQNFTLKDGTVFHLSLCQMKLDNPSQHHIQQSLLHSLYSSQILYNGL